MGKLKFIKGLMFTIMFIFFVTCFCYYILNENKHLYAHAVNESEQSAFNRYLKGIDSYQLKEQVYISYGDKINEIMITWSVVDIEFPIARIKYGNTEPNREVFVRAVQHREPTRNRTTYRALLQNLKYNTSYVYKIYTKNAWSHPFSFKTPPRGTDWLVRVIAFADYGLSNDVISPYLHDDAASNHYDAVLHIGDMVYDIGDHDGLDCDFFLELLEPISSKIPYMVNPGNHENADDFAHYKSRFSMPGPHQNMFYSFNLGPIHFVSINTEVYFDPIRKNLNRLTKDKNAVIEYYNLLKIDLEKASRPRNRAKRPWIIVYGHRPFYCSVKHDPEICPTGYLPNRDGLDSLTGYYYGLETLLQSYGVDFAIWGHMHSYERFWPVYQFQVYNGSYEHPYVNPGALVQVTTGAAGSHLRLDSFIHEPGPWSALRLAKYGYGRLYCHNNSHLYYEQLAVADADGHLYNKSVMADSFWLIKYNRTSYKIRDSQL